TGSINGSARTTGNTNTADASSPGPAKPSPINDTAVSAPPPDREARLDTRKPANAHPQPIRFTKAAGPANQLTQLESSLNRVERRQIAELNSVEDRMESRVRRMRGVFSDLGLKMTKMEAGTPPPGTG